jgi:hypothetical protein
MMGEMKHEYHEGPKAGENFKRLARAVFQTRQVARPKLPTRKLTPLISHTSKNKPAGLE